MACMMTLRMKELPRGKVIRLFLDLEKCGGIGYACSTEIDGKVRLFSHSMSYKSADTMFDDMELMATASSSWKAVLARLTGRREQPGKWQGSAAQVAADLYGLATWKWIRFLVAYRRDNEEYRSAA